MLRWFEGIEEARNMPWRKRWLDPSEFEGGEEEFGKLLERRAYEVWVSEVSKYLPCAEDLHFAILRGCIGCGNSNTQLCEKDARSRVFYLA